MLRNPNLMSFTLWLLTILSISIAMIFGLVAAIFSIINTVMTPIETITGVQGLYLWNALASKFYFQEKKIYFREMIVLEK